MALVLTDWVEKFIFATVFSFDPVFGMFGATDKPGHIFGFYDKYSVLRHDNMVDLDTAMWGFNHNIVEHNVFVIWQRFQPARDGAFANIATNWVRERQPYEKQNTDNYDYCHILSLG